VNKKKKGGNAKRGQAENIIHARIEKNVRIMKKKEKGRKKERGKDGERERGREAKLAVWIGHVN